MASARPSPGSEPAAPDLQRWLALAVVLAGVFMAILDVFIVNVAAPDIQRRLHTGSGTLELVVAGYTLAYAMVLITGARLGDDRGHRRFFLAGLSLFTVASGLCGIAPDPGLLVAARITQGVASGLMVPQVLSIVQVRFTGEERTRAIGLYGLTLGLASVAGQVVGGLLLQWNPADLGWRTVFLVNLPIGTLTVLCGRRLLTESRAPAPRPVDPVGIAVLSVGVLALVLPLVQGREAHWAPWTFVSLAASAGILTSFVVLQRRSAVHGRATLVDLDVFANRQFRWGLASIFFVQCCAGALFLMLTVHLQAGHGFTALHSGLTFLPVGVAFAAVSLLTRRLPARLQGVVTPLGILGLMGAALALAWAVARSGWSATWGLPLLALTGGGLGAGYTPQVTMVLSRVGLARVASASGLLATTVQLGNLIGIATLGSLFFAVRDGSHLTGAPASDHGFALALVCLAAVAGLGLACFTRLGPAMAGGDAATGLVAVAE